MFRMARIAASEIAAVAAKKSSFMSSWMLSVQSSSAPIASRCPKIMKSIRHFSDVSVEWTQVELKITGINNAPKDVSCYLNLLNKVTSSFFTHEEIFDQAHRGISIRELRHMLAAAEHVYSLSYGLPFRGKQGEPGAYPVLTPDRLLDLEKLPNTVINPLTGKEQDRIVTGLEDYLKGRGTDILKEGRISEIPTYYFYRHRPDAAPIVQLTSGGILQSGFLKTNPEIIVLRIFFMGTPLPFGRQEQMALVPGNKLAAFAAKIDALDAKMRAPNLSREMFGQFLREKIALEKARTDYLNSPAVQQLFEQQPPIYCGTPMGNPQLLKPANIETLREEVQWWGQVYNTNLVQLDKKDYTILWRLFGVVEIPEGLANRAENDMRAVLQEICLLPRITQCLMKKLLPYAHEIKIDDLCLAAVMNAWPQYSTEQKLMELKRWGTAIFWHDAAFDVLKEVLNHFQFRLTVTGHSAGATATNMLAACFHRLGLQITEDSKLAGFGPTCPPAAMSADIQKFAERNRLLNIMIAGDPYSMHNLHCAAVSPVPASTVINFNLPEDENRKIYHVLQAHLPGAFAQILRNRQTALSCFNPPCPVGMQGRLPLRASYMTMPKTTDSTMTPQKIMILDEPPHWVRELMQRASMYWRQ